MGLSFHARARGRGKAERARSHLTHRLGELGFRVRLPTFETGLDPEEPNPGEFSPCPNRVLAHPGGLDAIAALFPLAWTRACTNAEGFSWGCSDDANPVFLNRWAHGSYSWGLFGSTGAGKSFAAALGPFAPAGASRRPSCS